MARLEDLVAEERRSLTPPPDAMAQNRLAIDDALAKGWRVPTELAGDLTSVATTSSWTKALLGIVLAGSTATAVGVAVLDDSPDKLEDRAPLEAAEALEQPEQEPARDESDPELTEPRGREVSESQANVDRPASPSAPPSARNRAHIERSPGVDSSRRPTPSAAPASRDVATPSRHESSHATRPRNRSRDGSASAHRSKDHTAKSGHRENSAREPDVGHSPASPAPGARYADELALLEQAKHYLDVGSVRRARRILRRHEQEFPRGTFAAEREAMLVVCTCALTEDRTTRRRAAQRYESEHTRSPFLSHIRRACQDDGSP